MIYGGRSNGRNARCGVIRIMILAALTGLKGCVCQDKAAEDQVEFFLAQVEAGGTLAAVQGRLAGAPQFRARLGKVYPEYPSAEPVVSEQAADFRIT